MIYIGNLANAVRTAVLDASNIVPSEAVYRSDENAHDGGGRIDLTGAFTGQADARYDVEIVDTDAGDSPHISAPEFTGLGNGEMTDTTVDAGTAAQTFAVTLEDLGTQTRAAYAPFQSATLRAQDPGPAGNDITVSVDISALTSTATDYALQEDLRQGTNEYSGDYWNFGAATLNPDGTLPDTAPRLRFGIDPQVYRAYRRYVSGAYIYGFSPSPVRDVARGERVYAITGARTVTITDGSSTDTLPGIVSLYDCLSAIRTSSTLVEVDGVIVNDKLPGGQGATDLGVRTAPYITALERDGSDAVQQADVSIVPDATAPTEQLSLTCADTGGTTWHVRGDVSGNLDDLTTGVTYADGAYTIDIPIPPRGADEQPGARIHVEYIPATRDEGAGVPAVCIERAVLGAQARNGTWDFVYSARPAEDCDCATGDLEGGPTQACLGENPTGDTDVTESQRLRRLQRLTAAIRDLVTENSSPPTGCATHDIRWIETSASILADGLDRMQSGDLAPAAWEGDTAYAVDDVRQPVGGNGYRYAANVAGTNGSSEPTWPTTVGDTVTDGGVTWECIGKLPYGMWDDLFASWQDDANTLISDVPSFGGPVYPEWRAATPYGFSTQVIPITRNGHLYQVISAPSGSGLSGNTEPTWPTDGSSVTDNNLDWLDRGAYWSASTAYALDATVSPGDGYQYTADPAGTSGSSEPIWPGDSGSVVDGTVTWTAVEFSIKFNLGADPVDICLDLYRTAVNDILAAAGLDPNFEGAGTQGDGCWLDYADSDYWWAYDGSDVPPYLPVQTGHYYHAAVLDTDADGDPYIHSTGEFGFGARIGCPERLQPGDILRVSVVGAGGISSNGYQQGDRITAQVTRATPLEFGGGQDGDDTLTWSVVGSVDGRLDDYALVTTALAAYSDGGIGFLITPGGIDFALGDQFSLDVEGGHFRWRRDGGAWSADLPIADTALDAGLTAAFTAGRAPSWATGDAWAVTAEAINGPDHARAPTEDAMTWSDSLTLDIIPADTTAISGVMLAAHTIPADAEIRVQGSDDDFATTPLDVALTWRTGAIWQALTADYAKYRITVDSAGSIGWVWLGVPLSMQIRTGAAEIGTLVKRWTLPSITRSQRALAVTVDHTYLTQASVDALLDMLDHACANDERRIGIVPAASGSETGVVAFDDESLEVTDLLAYQPTDPARRFLSASLQLEAV